MTTKGDTEKQPLECQALGENKMACPNLQEVGGDYEGERYLCYICGEKFFLDYDEMR